MRIPIPAGVRNLSDLRPSRGEAHWSPADGCVEWKIAGKDVSSAGAVLRCTIQGPLSEEDGDGPANGVLNGMTATTYDYDEEPPSSSTTHNSNNARGSSVERYRGLMPTSATLTFSLKGWLASGLKVESLLVDTKKSRGLGVEVKPYKGVKYLTVSREGVEVRC